MSPALSTREAATLAMLAACNAALEMTLGNYLRAVHFPMAGSTMVGLNLVVYAVGFLRVPRRGGILAIGLGTAFLNFVLTGSFKLLALPAIVLEAALIDAVLSTLGLNRVSLVTAGILSNLLALGWRLITGWLILGSPPAQTLARLVSEDFAARLSFPVLLGLLLASRALVGVLFALLAWRVLDLVGSALRARAAPQ